MPEDQKYVREHCQRYKKSYADLSRESKIPYPRLSGWINGYWGLRFDQEQKVRSVFRKWEAEEGADGK